VDNGTKSLVSCRLLAIACVAGGLWLALTASAGQVTMGPWEFAVLSGGSFGADQGVQIRGNVGAVGSVWFAKNSTVTGGVYSNSQVSLDQSTAVSGRIVSGSDIYLARYASAGSLDAFRNVSLDRNTSVGAITALKNVSIDKSSTVAGNVAYNGSYWAGSGVSIQGSVTRGKADPDVWSVTLRSDPGLATSSSRSLWYATGSTINLNPGDYGQLSVDRNATIYLTAGVYNFSSIWIGRETKIVADTSAGNVVVNVTGGLSMDRQADIDRTGANYVTFQAGGNVWLGRDANAQASFLSYNGTVSIDTCGYIDGFLYSARDMWLGANTQVTGTGLSGAMQAVPEPATLAMLLLGLPLLRTRRWRGK